MIGVLRMKNAALKTAMIIMANGLAVFVNQVSLNLDLEF